MVVATGGDLLEGSRIAKDLVDDINRLQGDDEVTVEEVVTEMCEDCNSITYSGPTMLFFGETI